MQRSSALVCLTLLAVLPACSSLRQARKPTADDCANYDKARQRWQVAGQVALGLGAGAGVATLTPAAADSNTRTGLGVGVLLAAGVSALAAHEQEVLVREYLRACTVE
jgi:hypothetical protein